MIHHIEPDETHVLKAVAWDAMYSGLLLEEPKYGKQVQAVMDSIFDAVGERLSNPKTWEVTMRKLNDENLYMHKACGTASAKASFKYMVTFGRDFYLCPSCGSLVDLAVGNDNVPKVKTAPPPKSNGNGAKKAPKLEPKPKPK